MKTTLQIAALAAIALPALCNEAARAQSGAVVEQIVVTLSPQPPGNVFEQFYPNEFDLNHPKLLSFFGTLTNASLTAPAFVDLWFDYLDPADPTAPKTTPVIPIDLLPGEVRTIAPGAAIRELLPFCPPQVSIHIQNNGPGGPVIVDGLFIHECIPEPSSLALAAMAMSALVAVHRRRV